MLVSHYVIEEILKDWDDLKVVKEKFEKFSKRYPQDREFQDIYEKFQKVFEKGKKKELEKIKQKLESLKSIRRLETSGGAKDLPYSDRRRLSD